MKEVNGIVNVQGGLSARLSAQIVAEANKYKSNIKIVSNEEEADLKSIMDVMALIIPHGASFSIMIDGGDEDIALSSFVKLLIELNLK